MLTNLHNPLTKLIFCIVLINKKDEVNELETIF